MIRAVLFDLWFTLAYLEGVREAKVRLVEMMGRGRYETYKHLWIRAHREPIDPDAFIGALQRELGNAPLTSEETEIIRFRYGGSPYHVYPETIEVLAWAKKRYKLALISNCIMTTGPMLDALNIRSYFDAIILSYEVGFRKPEQEIFAMALERLDARPEEAIMIGDEERQDMAGAAGIGAQGILIDREGAHEFPRKISNLLELRSIL